MFLLHLLFARIFWQLHVKRATYGHRREKTLNSYLWSLCQLSYSLYAGSKDLEEAAHMHHTGGPSPHQLNTHEPLKQEINPRRQFSNCTHAQTILT